MHVLTCSFVLFVETRYGEAVYFSLSMGILMYIYEFKPEAINSRYRDILVRFLGVN